MVTRSRRRKQRAAAAAAPAPHPAAAPAAPRSYALPCLLLFAGMFVLYGGSYHYPLVFDDRILNPADLPRLARSCAEAANRCLSYSTFGLTYLAAGLDLFWFRAGNVFCHGLAALSCFLFLDRLFDAVRRSAEAYSAPASRDRLLAFCGAAWFAVHPVAVYGVAYLVQRSIVMSTMFSLLSLAAFIHALTSSERRWLWLAASALLYVAALLSKEHAIMLPAVAVAIAVLLRRHIFNSRIELLILAGAIAIVAAAAAIRLRHLIGTTPEYFTRELAAFAASQGRALDPVTMYLGSAMTQTFLFFKYLLLWLVPWPGWMSVDLRQPLAAGPLQWPFVLGVPAFLAWGAAMALLVRRGGAPGLLGFGLLFPWLLFFTEFVTARVQEPFVLYRSYLWMAGVPAVLPFIAHRASSRAIAAAFVAAALLLIPSTRDRLSTFASDLALWDDAARKNTDTARIFTDRALANRAVALLREGRLDEAQRDLEQAIALNPKNSHAYVNRGTVRMRRGELPPALADLDHAIALDPAFAEAHGERCALLIRMEDPAGALQSCNAALALAPELPTALLNRAVLLARAQRLPEALADLDRILRVEPDNAVTLYNRGTIYRQTGRAAEADRDLRTSCKAGFAPACAPPK